jgi:hypothetical protein
MALIILCALPVFASTPEQDMVLVVDEGDGDFSGLQQISEEELGEIFGNLIPDDYHLGSQEYFIHTFGSSDTEKLTIRKTKERLVIKPIFPYFN